MTPPVQQFERPTGIGGTDISALLGLSPYKTPVQLWAEKVGRTSPSQRTDLHLRFGKYLEPFVANEYEAETGLKTFSPPGPLFHKEHAYMFASVDRLVSGSSSDPVMKGVRVVADRILECKTASAFSKDEWGEIGTDQVPATYLLQCAWYLAITGCERADLAVLIGNADFRIYSIWRDLRLESLLLENASRFWHENVIGQIPPSIKNRNDLQILFPSEEKEKCVEADHEMLELLNRYRQSRVDAVSIENYAEDIRLQVMSAMGPAQSVKHEGELVASWRSVRPSSRLDLRALKYAYPEIVERFSIAGQTTRRFVVHGKAESGLS